MFVGKARGTSCNVEFELVEDGEDVEAEPGRARLESVLRKVCRAPGVFGLELCVNVGIVSGRNTMG